MVIALIILSSFLLPGCSQKEVDHNLVQMRSGIAYLPNESEPFSGTATAYYPSGQKQIEASYKDGMPTAKKLEWYANGQIKTEQHYSGEDIGRIRDWNENGEVSRDIRILNRTLVGKNVWRSLDFEGEINSFNGLIDGVHIYNFKDDTFSQNNAKGLPLSFIVKIKSESSNLSNEVIYEYNQDGSKARLAYREYRYEYKSEQSHLVTEVKLENAEAKIITKKFEQNKDEDPTTVTTEEINKWFDMTPVKITVELENGSYMMEASSFLKTFSLETGLLDGPSWHTNDSFLEKYSYSQGILNGYSDSFDRTTATWSEDCYILGEWEFDEEICKALFGEWNPPLNKNIPKHIKHLIDQDKEKAAKAKEEERKKKAEEERKKKAEEERKKKAEEERKKMAEEERKKNAEEERKKMAEEERKKNAEEETENLKYQRLYDKGIMWSGNTGILMVEYQSSDAQTTGIGFRVHFDSSAIRPINVQQFPVDALVTTTAQMVMPDSNNRDNNINTDQVLTFAWASIYGQWPQTNQVTLATIEFERVEGGSANDTINYTAVSVPNGFKLIK